VTEGLDGLWDIAPGRGRKPVFQIDKIAAIVDATLQTKAGGDDTLELPDYGAEQGVSKSTVNNILAGHNLQPHRTETFKLSRDPEVLEKDDRCGGSVSESPATGDQYSA